MLSLLSTILSWDDTEREKAGLQRVGATGITPKGDKGKGKGRPERSAEEEAAMNEVSKSNYTSLRVSLIIVIQ